MNLSNPPMRTEPSDREAASRYTDLTLIARQPATSSGVRSATGDLCALTSVGRTSPHLVRYFFKNYVYKRNNGEEGLGVYYVPSWQTPINVELEEAHQGVTYGLVCTELVEADWPNHDFPPRLVERLGLDNLILASRECGRVSRATRKVEILAPLLRDFVTRELAALVAPILATAAANGSISDYPREDVLSLVGRYGPSSPRPRRLRQNNRAMWGQTFAHLLERAATEVFELYATHARLRRCRFCKSVFVPRRDEHACRWNLWPAPMQVGDPVLRLCSEARTVELEKSGQPASERTVYDRERRRLWAQYDREKKAAIKAGKDPKKSPRVTRKAKALSDFIQHQGPKRGRPTREDAPDVRDEPTGSSEPKTSTQR